ncbi:Protease HtpX [Planctomycetes bacterium Poly30]|uniref:Protease HtpX n=1 Tax=Saltatorellus ferox TaxID=2528018 RepID=A0A518EM07_9BACT|nr:Protease HtpX [Planctomycetes bacterium Poly30]
MRPSLSTPRRLLTPTRESLLRDFRAHEFRSLLRLAVEVVIIAAGLSWWYLQAQSPDGPVRGWKAGALFAVGFLGLFDFVVTQFLSNRKALEDLRPDARFGPHTRDSLLAAVQRVQARLGLGQQRLRVYLAREKDVNASAMRCELLPGWHLLNSVQLNRSIVHLLDEKELESVIGHELGHLFPYAPILRRCMLVHGALAGVLSLVIAQWLYPADFYVFAPLVAILIGRWFAFSTTGVESRLVEFLCDDFGARAAGLTPALTAEIKLGAEHEARSTLLMRVLEAKLQSGSTPIADLMKEYENAMPFGGVQSEEARAQMERGIQARIKQNDETSLMGFFKFAWQGDQTDHTELEQELARMRAVREVAKVPLDPARVLGEPRLMGEMMELLEAYPDRLLFHIPEEISDRGSSHPNVSRRLLYLWRNRDAIASAV